MRDFFCITFMFAYDNERIGMITIHFNFLLSGFKWMNNFEIYLIPMSIDALAKRKFNKHLPAYYLTVFLFDTFPY